MAYEILIETEGEKHAPPSQPLLRLAYTKAGNGYAGVMHFDIVKIDETNVATTTTPIAHISVNAQEFFQALAGLGPVQSITVDQDD